MRINIATDSTETLLEALDHIETIYDLYGYTPANEVRIEAKIKAELAKRAA
jgi:hypothetical protein